MGLDALQKEKEAGVDWNRELTQFPGADHEPGQENDLTSAAD